MENDLYFEESPTGNITQKTDLLIIIPTYERSKEALSTYEEIRRQWMEMGHEGREKKIKIIISDNFSKDEGYLNLEKKVRLNGDTYKKNEKNLGLIGNIYSNLSSIHWSNYVWFVGDDDEYRNGLLKEILLKIEKKPGYVFINHEIEYKDSRIKVSDSVIGKNKISNIIDIYKYTGTTMMLLSASVYQSDLLIKAIKTDRNEINRLSAPLYWSFYCAENSIEVIYAPLIKNIWGETSWKSDSDEVFFRQVPSDLFQIKLKNYSLKNKIYIIYRVILLKSIGFFKMAKKYFYR